VGARSRDPFDELVEEVRAQVADGAREVTLLGQNVNSYGRDLRPDRRSFAELLHALDAIEGLDRLRYTSPHPKDMREDVVRAHAELASVCEHIHLPLQSGSSAILKAMRRTYDRGRYLDRVALIRELVPDCAITTDIIVGFPARPRRTSSRRWRCARRSATTARSPSCSRRAAVPRRRP
jgi:tRNA-2-methylthio-N6-dimethylallyladenosine synthase